MRGVDRALSGEPDDFALLKALRPFSFSVALISCALGIRLALLEGYGDWQQAGLIFLAGLLAQSGVNLVNDMGDWEDLVKYQTEAVRRLVKRNFLLGLFCFFLAAGVALYLLQDANVALLWICLIGLVGALGYALPPVDLKGRGLAVVMVFWLMGVLMIYGAYLAMGGGWQMDVLVHSIPVSLLVSQLLLSNEIRDYESDKRRELKTLSFRIGLTAARQLYRSILVAVFVLPIVFYLAGLLTNPLWLLPAVFLLKPLLRLIKAEEGGRKDLPPMTARLLMVFGLLYMIAV